ncbi:MAG: hypothetical protein M0P61_08490 [Ignavibacteriaceae bacterium]|jgi:predicted anti-sigma-YlaC factor YlaD|nr:hypothetical protein [Ignavibacteriaceae bacterium]
MNKEKVSCKDVMGHICESLSEEMNSPKCVAIKEHLETCHGCKSYFTSVEMTIDLYKKCTETLPGDVHKKLMAFLELTDEQ